MLKRSPSKIPGWDSSRCRCVNNGDYCDYCNELDENNPDYLWEAYRILSFQTAKLPTFGHLEALSLEIQRLKGIAK